MPIENPLTTTDMLTPDLSLAAQRVGKHLQNSTSPSCSPYWASSFSAGDFSGLAHLPKPRVRTTMRAKVEREQLLLLLPVHDDMCER